MTVELNHLLKNHVFSMTILAPKNMQSLLKMHESHIYEQKHTVWGNSYV